MKQKAIGELLRQIADMCDSDDSACVYAYNNELRDIREMIGLLSSRVSKLENRSSKIIDINSLKNK